tara:strand:- start:318 stop:713 length:396 start_codon:yes stop_codon:yes gene_type:complete
MKILDEYLNELSQDTALDEFTVKDMQMKLPAIKHKWAGRLIRTKFEVTNLERGRDRLINKAVQQLIEESPVKLAVPLARQRVEGLDDIQDIKDKIQDTKTIIEFLEKAERILNSMTFDIKNLTEIMKMETQ